MNGISSTLKCKAESLELIIWELPVVGIYDPKKDGKECDDTSQMLFQTFVRVLIFHLA